MYLIILLSKKLKKRLEGNIVGQDDGFLNIPLINVTVERDSWIQVVK